MGKRLTNDARSTRRRWMMAAAAGVLCAVATNSVAFAEGLVGAGTEGAEGTYVAVSPTGYASSSQGVAVSAAGPASGATAAVSGTQGASSGGVAVSGLGGASAGVAGVSVAGNAGGGVVGASTVGDSGGGTVSVSGIGETSGPLMASAHGVDAPYPVGVDGSLDLELVAPGTTFDGITHDPVGTTLAQVAWNQAWATATSDCVVRSANLTGSTPSGCTPTTALAAYTADCLSRNPTTPHACSEVGGYGNTSYARCENCSAHNGVTWTDRGDSESVRPRDIRSRADETIDTLKVHAALINANRKYKCNTPEAYSESTLKWNDMSQADFSSMTRWLARDQPVNGQNRTWTSTSGHDWWDDGAHWNINTTLDICRSF